MFFRTGNISSKSSANCVKRVYKVGPGRSICGAIIDSPGAVPASNWMLGFENLFLIHAGKIIVTLIKLADMVETQPAIFARTIIAIAGTIKGGRSKFSAFLTSLNSTDLSIGLDTTVKAVGLFPIGIGRGQKEIRLVIRIIAGNNYIGSMQTESKGPVAQEIEKRLMTELSPLKLNVINDSAKHHGHAGDDGSGESHFTVEIECADFKGQSRLNRQRMVNKALGDLMREKVHAMAIKAKAPGE